MQGSLEKEENFYFSSSISLQSLHHGGCCWEVLEKQPWLGLKKKSLQFLSFTKVPFIYHVSTFSWFWDTPPPYISMVLLLKISKNWHLYFLDSKVHPNTCCGKTRINKPERVFGLQVQWREWDTFKILEIFWEFLYISGNFLGFFWRIFFGGIFWEKFLGGFFWEDFLGGIILRNLIRN